MIIIIIIKADKGHCRRYCRKCGSVWLLELSICFHYNTNSYNNNFNNNDNNNNKNNNNNRSIHQLKDWKSFSCLSHYLQTYG